MRYTDLFIDFDDTLYDTRGNATLALRELFELYHWERHFDTPDDFITPYWRINDELWHQYAHGEIDRDTLIIERFRRPLALGRGLSPTAAECEAIGERFLQLNAEKTAVVEGAHELMQHLADRGYRLHLCSNGFGEVQYHKLAASDLGKYFHTVVLSEDAGANKPAPAFFDYAFAQTGAARATTLMIGDNFATDILGAMGVGLDTLFFNRKPEGFHALQPPTYEVHRLDEIAKIL